MFGIYLTCLARDFDVRFFFALIRVSVFEIGLEKRMQQPAKPPPIWILLSVYHTRNINLPGLLQFLICRYSDHSIKRTGRLST